MKHLYSRIVIIFCCLTPLGAFSQDLDIHWTQHYHAPFYINPALTGVFSGDHRVIGNYRNQWYTVPVRYETFALSYDRKFYHPKLTKGLFGGGIQLMHDQAGASKLRTFQVLLSASYQHMLARKHFLIIGAQGGFNNRRYDTGDLTFDSQWQIDQFDPNNPHGETFLNTRFSYPTFGTGLNYHYQAMEGSDRNRLDFGLGWFNFNTPYQKFNENTKYRMLPRYTTHLSAAFKISGPFDLMARGLGMLQGPNYESTVGLGVRYHVSEAKTRELAIQAGVDYRFNENDAWAPMVGVDFRQWRLAFSWDLNTSKFQQATNMNGGPELSIQYIFTSVKPLPILKSCPIY